MSPFKSITLPFAISVIFSISGLAHAGDARTRGHIVAVEQGHVELQLGRGQLGHEGAEIGRASCRERV